MAKPQAASFSSARTGLRTTRCTRLKFSAQIITCCYRSQIFEQNRLTARSLQLEKRTCGKKESKEMKIVQEMHGIIPTDFNERVITFNINTTFSLHKCLNVLSSM